MENMFMLPNYRELLWNIFPMSVWMAVLKKKQDIYWISLPRIFLWLWYYDGWAIHLCYSFSRFFFVFLSILCKVLQVILSTFFFMEIVKLELEHMFILWKKKRLLWSTLSANITSCGLIVLLCKHWQTAKQMWKTK